MLDLTPLPEGCRLSHLGQTGEGELHSLPPFTWTCSLVSRHYSRKDNRIGMGWGSTPELALAKAIANWNRQRHVPEPRVQITLEDLGL